VKKGVALVSAAILAIGAVAIRGLVRELSSLSVELDKMAKTAKGLGVSFRFLEDMQFVFGRLGGDGGPQTMIKLFKSLGDATDEAAQGSAEYLDEFVKLRLDAKKFIKLKPEEQLIALHKAYQLSAKGTAEQAAMSALLGRGWVKNISVFAASTEELVRLIDKRRDLGGLTAESGALAETFEDVKRNVDQVKRGMSDKIFKAFAPAMIEMAKSTQTFFTWLSKTGLVVPVLKGSLVVLVSLMVGAAAALIVLAATVAGPALAAFGTFAALAAVIGGSFTYISTQVDGLVWALKELCVQVDKVRDFGGAVLEVLGFGSDDDFFSSGEFAPQRSGSSLGAYDPSKHVTASTVVNIDATGMTPEQVQRLIKQQQAHATSGKKK
jgi:hypothetical protein